MSDEYNFGILNEGQPIPLDIKVPWCGCGLTIPKLEDVTVEGLPDAAILKTKEGCIGKHKEVKFSVRISDHDYGYRMEQVKKFLSQKFSVMAKVQFKGREMSHPELGHNLLSRLLTDLNKKGTPKLNGRTLQVFITP